MKCKLNRFGQLPPRITAYSHSKTVDILLSAEMKCHEVPSRTYNDLGVIFSNANGRFRENYENKHGKVLRAIYAARRLAHGTIGRDIALTVLF